MKIGHLNLVFASALPHQANFLIQICARRLAYFKFGVSCFFGQRNLFVIRYNGGSIGGQSLEQRVDLVTGHYDQASCERTRDPPRSGCSSALPCPRRTRRSRPAVAMHWPARAPCQPFRRNSRNTAGPFATPGRPRAGAIIDGPNVTEWIPASVHTRGFGLAVWRFSWAAAWLGGRMPRCWRRLRGSARTQRLRPSRR